jgi:hypothetical protein
MFKNYFAAEGDATFIFPGCLLEKIVHEKHAVSA